VKTLQYLKQEKAIAFCDGGSIRGRWRWGLRLLRDPEAVASEKSLKHGVSEQLIAAAKRAGLKLSEREIRRRIQCAKAYPTEGQIGRAVADFSTWRDLSDANFPPYPADLQEPPADHRDDAERHRELARQLMSHASEQLDLFPLDTFDQATSTLSQLQVYTEEQDALTARFVARGALRRSYLERLILAADGDLSTTWAVAHERLTAIEGDGGMLGQNEETVEEDAHLHLHADHERRA
jgi:hypothetical protein